MNSTNSTSMVELNVLNLWLLKVMLRCINDVVTTIKPGHQTTGNTFVIWSDESSFTLFRTSGRGLSKEYLTLGEENKVLYLGGTIPNPLQSRHLVTPHT
jgi:hypothetical protein